MATMKKNGEGRYYEYVIDSIKDMIARGELKAGDKLPSERDLAERFNVSRVPIREALKILEYIGILDSSLGEGTFVKDSSVEQLINKMDFAVVTTAKTLIELLEIRIFLESFSAYHAALNHTDEDVAAMKKALEDMREAKKNPNVDDEAIANLRELSHEFHRCVVRAAHNSVLLSMYESLYQMLDISRQFTIDTSGISYNSILAHEAIFHKIVQRDADGVSEAMQGHMDEVRTNLTQKLADAKTDIS